MASGRGAVVSKCLMDFFLLLILKMLPSVFIGGGLVLSFCMGLVFFRWVLQMGG
jgi:hypothetical protein